MSACEHTAALTVSDGVLGVPPRTQGCEECLANGSSWLHLRRCVTCGRVGCCDDSPATHARLHAEQESHPVMQSFEPAEDWVYCFVHQGGFTPHEGVPSPSHP